MTVYSTETFTDWVATDGVKKNFNYDFTVFVSTDMYILTRLGLDGPEVRVDSGFTMTPANPNFSSGVVTYPSSGPAIATGSYIRLVREVDYTQNQRIGNEGSFRPEIHERALDRLTQQTQQLAEGLSRALKVALGDTAPNLPELITDIETAVVDAEAAADAAIDAAATAVGLIGLASTALQPADIGTDTADKVATKEASYNYVLNKEIILSNIPSLDPTGVADSYAVLAALQATHAATGFQFKVPRQGKIKLATDFVLTRGQSLVADRPPSDASGVIGNDYNVFGNTIKLASNAHIRLDNGGRVENLLIYRDGLRFNEDQGDFSEWTGKGVVLGYGNDQVVENCMILGFDICLATLTDRGLAGPGRVILNRVYVDGKNGFKLVGSYDNAFFDILRAFGFVTQGYAGDPVPGEGYDPRKDRRPGVGFQMLDGADGTSLGRSQMFSYAIGYDINCGGWDAEVMMADYGTTTTYNSGGSGTIGILLRADTDPTGPRYTDYSPCNIAYAHAWSSEVPLKIVGEPGRIAQIGVLSITNAYGDAVQIDGGGLQCENVNMALVTGAPVRFLSAPDTKTTIKGKVTQFGAARNSDNVPVVKLPAGSNANLIDVKLASDQGVGSAYFDNHPVFPTVASADPLSLPAYQGGESEGFTVTGTAAMAFMYGIRPGLVHLYFTGNLSLFNGAGPGGFRLPGNMNTVDVTAGTVAVCEYDKTSDRWNVLSISASYAKYDSSGRVMLSSGGVSVPYIGSDTPEAQLSKSGAARLGMGRWTNDTGGPQIQFVKSRNPAIGGHTIVAANDVLASIRAAASDGSTFLESASIVAVAETVPSGGGAPGYLSLRTAKGTDNFASEKVRIDSFGNIIAYALRQFADDAAAAAASPPVPINGFYINSSTKALQPRLV